MTEPEQWAVELWHLAHRAYVLKGRDSHLEGAVDAALTIQRAFEEQTRELRAEMAFVQQSHDWIYGEKQRLENALKDIASRAHANLATRQDAPVTENSDDH